MRYFSFLFAILFLCLCSNAQLSYMLTYKDSSSPVVHISIQLPTPQKGPLNFIMPRSIPGHYAIARYDNFIQKLYAIGTNGEKYEMIIDVNAAPRFHFNDSIKKVNRIEYDINLDAQERKNPPSDVSILRPGFAGILNYSVFGWIEGTENMPVQCSVETFDNWPIFSTNQPGTSQSKGGMKFSTTNYYELADGQLFIGPAFHVKEFKGLVPLFIASYSQGSDEWLDDYGSQGIISMGILKDYFGEIPFKQYSIMLRSAIPLEPGNYPPFGMEHLQSATFFGDTSSIRRSPMNKDEVMRTIPTYLHHMGHAWIPLRCYGDNYLPHVLEIPPLIKNIWFNEGFMWFLPYDTLHNERMKTGFYNNTYNTAPEIKKLSLMELSQSASTMYSADFRLGRAVYSRGASMAIEMNNYLEEKTNGKKSMKDVLRYLYNWSKENKRPFTMEEFPELINKACGIDLSAIYKKWQLPIE